MNVNCESAYSEMQACVASHYFVNTSIYMFPCCILSCLDVVVSCEIASATVCSYG